MARAYVAGDLVVDGVHPGDPYDADAARCMSKLTVRARRRPRRSGCCAGWGSTTWCRRRPPPQEPLPRWRRMLEGSRHTKTRDAEAIHHHYDVSNRFYELVLGPSMTYTCACYPSDGRHPRGGAGRQVRPGRPQARPQPGMRLLDVGCGWGGMVRHAAKHYGVARSG